MRPSRSWLRAVARHGPPGTYPWADTTGANHAPWRSDARGVPEKGRSPLLWGMDSTSGLVSVSNQCCTGAAGKPALGTQRGAQMHTTPPTRTRPQGACRRRGLWRSGAVPRHRDPTEALTTTHVTDVQKFIGVRVGRRRAGAPRLRKGKGEDAWPVSNAGMRRCGCRQAGCAGTRRRRARPELYLDNHLDRRLETDCVGKLSARAVQTCLLRLLILITRMNI